MRAIFPVQRGALCAAHTIVKVLYIMLFASFLGMLEAIVKLNDAATAGNIQKMNMHLTIGQVKRLLCQLESEGYVHHKLEAYGRTGKRVYYLSGVCATNVNILNFYIVEAGYVPQVNEYPAHE